MWRRIKRRRLFTVVLALMLAAAAAVTMISAGAAEYTVTNKGSVSDGVSKVGRFTIDGKPAFCCDHDKTTPPTGTKVTKSSGNSGNIAKVLYYGYGGPGEWSGFAGENEAIVATSLALDYYFNGGSRSGNPNFSEFMEFLSSKGTGESGTSYILYTSGKASHQRLAAVNPSIEVSVSLTKESADDSFTEGNGSYSLRGAKYGIYSGSKQLAVMVTDANGKASARITVSPDEAANIKVKELEPSKGHVKDSTTYSRNGSSGKATVTSKEPPVYNPVELALFKYDSETGKNDGDTGHRPQKGGSLAGAVFKADFYGAEASDGDYSKLTPLRTWYFETDADGIIRYSEDHLADGYEQSELYKAPDGSGETALPLGTIVYKEVKAPEGYIADDELHVCTIKPDGDKEAVDTYRIPYVPDEIKRGDIELVKIADGSASRMAGIPFMITSLQEHGLESGEGESHVIVTDENGYFSTEGSFNSRLDNMNGNDAAWDGKSIDISKTDPQAGVWFGEEEAADDEKGALPYGRYRIDELPCDKNSGYSLLEGIEIYVTRDGYTIDLGTMTNDRIEIETSVWDSELNEERVTMARDSMTLTDRVSFKGLEEGEEYTVRGILMDKASGEPIMIDGAEIESEKTFTAKRADGTVDVEFKFDGYELRGKQIVVFETLIRNGIVVAKHEDIDDLDQTIKLLNPAVKTTAKGMDGAKQIRPGTAAVIIDEVQYDGLMRGCRYEVRGTLMDKASGEPVLLNGKEVSARKEFTADKRSGTAEVKFEIDATSLAGRDIVVFEEIYWDGRLIAEHRDIDDAGQTVYIRSGVPVITGDEIPPSLFAAVTAMTAACAAAAAAALRPSGTVRRKRIR